MSRTKIEWADNVWNPTIGCSKVSTGCKHCYAERFARRLKAMGHDSYDDVIDDESGKWTGNVTISFELDGQEWLEFPDR